jgi:NADP-dependent aldehyde dehydrogenase
VRGVNPATGEVLEPAFTEASAGEVDRVVRAAEAAFEPFAALPPSRRAAFLRAIGEEIVSLGDGLLQRAQAETALPLPRLTGERGRTVAQLGLFADLIEEGSWVEARIDRPLPDRQPLPRPDLRRMLVPLGPVAVFGASNVLVEHPLVRAAAFTGSLRGGRAIFDAGARRPEPIPVYAEMGSSNPVFVLPRALLEKGETIAKGLAASVTLGVGQFCTNPGLTVVESGGAADAFARGLGELLAAAPVGTLVHAGIKSAYDAGLKGRADTPGVSVLRRKAGRLVVNGVPTGEVSHAMHHGGPYPATTDSRSTSVGSAAIARFARPVCFQDVPEAFLPDELKAKNPRGMFRLVDGHLTQDAC